MVTPSRNGPDPPQKLAFREKLVGKGLSTDNLLKKLKTLHSQLADLDQDHTDVQSLSAVRAELISTSILLHKDRGVKAYAACCIADILKLYAPDAPYTQPELRDIFQFFFKQLENGLKGSDSSYYSQYFYLLESLSTVKSVVLVCDLPNADEVLRDIFRDFFKLIHRDLPRKMETFMGDILAALIDEAQSLPSQVLNILMAQFMDKNAGPEHAPYRLTVQVCQEAAAKLQRHVSIYFAELLVAPEDDEDSDFTEIKKTHELIKRLHAACPDLLPTVIPLFEEELHSEEVQLRIMATQVLGEMLAEKGGQELAKKFPVVWNAWLQRKNDKAQAVRLKFVESCKGLFPSLPDMRDVIEESLHHKLMDPDDKVRAAVCKIYSQLDYETALHHVSEQQLRAIAGRGADRKASVRVEALVCMGKLFNLAYPEIENNTTAAIQQFSWIPNSILEVIPVSPEVKPLVQSVVNEHLLPLPVSGKGADVDTTAWTTRLLIVVRYLEEPRLQTLLTLSGLAFRPTVFDHFVTACVQNNGGIIDENEEQIVARLAKLIQYISMYYPDQTKAAEDLQSFAKLNEGRLYKLLKTCMDVQTDVKALLKASNDFIRRVEQSSSSILGTMTAFLRMGSLQIVNQSSIPPLLHRIQKIHGTGITSTNVMGHNAERILKYISKRCPALYKTHVAEIVKALVEEKNETTIKVCLQALAALAKWDPTSAPTDSMLDRFREHVLSSNMSYAKFAARSMTFFPNKEEVCADVLDTIIDQFPQAYPQQLAAHVIVLAQFAKFVPAVIEAKSDVIIPFLTKQLLLKPSEDADIADPDENQEEWADDDEVSDILRAKIQAIKVCRYRSLARASSPDAMEVTTPVLKMLVTLVENSGTFTPGPTNDPKVMSRMRLQSAISLLHLSTSEVYATAISPKFIRLALMIQDTCFDVRNRFLIKLVAFLTPRRLPPRYNLIPFLTVLDPEADIKNLATSFVANQLRKSTPEQRLQHFEMIFIRLLHLLAHHPDFETSKEQLIDMSKYIMFYLDLVSTKENVSLLHHLALKGKTVRDAESHTHSENFYVVCELAQQLLLLRTQRGDVTIQVYPGKIKLPSDILRAMPTPTAANEVAKTVYLPEEATSWLKEYFKFSSGKDGKDKKKAPTKRKAPSATNGHAKRARTTKRRKSGDDDESEPQSGIESSDVEMAEAQDQASEAEDSPEENGEEKLGRGARSRAKAKAKRQATKARKKDKSSSPLSDVD
ncbi:armadillo-type protein [Mycena floridula]|nr:armadillo-type protein [Mycena floridula]